MPTWIDQNRLTSLGYRTTDCCSRCDASVGVDQSKDKRLEKASAVLQAMLPTRSFLPAYW